MQTVEIRERARDGHCICIMVQVVDTVEGKRGEGSEGEDGTGDVRFLASLISGSNRY